MPRRKPAKVMALPCLLRRRRLTEGSQRSRRTRLAKAQGPSREQHREESASHRTPPVEKSSTDSDEKSVSFCVEFCPFGAHWKHGPHNGELGSIRESARSLEPPYPLPPPYPPPPLHLPPSLRPRGLNVTDCSAEIRLAVCEESRSSSAHRRDGIGYAENGDDEGPKVRGQTTALPLPLVNNQGVNNRRAEIWLADCEELRANMKRP